MPDAASTETRSYQCRHLFADGHRCGSKSLRNEHFCYYHHTTHRSASSPAPRPAPAENPATAAFDLPFPEDRTSIQLAIAGILRRIALNQIDPRRAGLLLYGLQIASCNLPKPKAEPEDPEETIEDLELHPELGPLAPQAEFIPYKEQPSFLRGLFQEMGLNQKEDEQNHPPSTRTIPTLQASVKQTCVAGPTASPSDLGFLFTPHPGLHLDQETFSITCLRQYTQQAPRTSRRTLPNVPTARPRRPDAPNSHPSLRRPRRLSLPRGTRSTLRRRLHARRHRHSLLARRAPHPLATSRPEAGHLP